jgi:hypothetical protein
MERTDEHSGRLLAVARTLRYLADDPFAFETILRAVAAEYETAARSRRPQWLPIGDACTRVLERIAGEGRRRPATALRAAAARASVPSKRASR